ncbi:MAG: hypothetical protein K9L73_01410 [Spirochaetia bacterium]|nr:hypothetical protein [Spirochaetia bacterium]
MLQRNWVLRGRTIVDNPYDFAHDVRADMVRSPCGYQRPVPADPSGSCPALFRHPMFRRRI